MCPTSSVLRLPKAAAAAALRAVASLAAWLYVRVAWPLALRAVEWAWPPPAVSSNPFLGGNYAPVEGEAFGEVSPQRGSLPPSLAGVFVRNGPNPALVRDGASHWFDGDGMLHAVRLRPGGAAPPSSYCSHWVRTARLALERAAGRTLHARIGETHGVQGLLRLALTWAHAGLRRAAGLAGDKLRGGGSNTAAVFHAGRLLALVEVALPYHVRVEEDGQLRSVGYHSYGGRLEHPFTAHPKVDPRTGEMFFFGYALGGADAPGKHVQYSVVSPRGELRRTVPVTLPRQVMMHDFAVTERYAVFLDLPLCFDRKAVLKDRMAFTWRGAEHGARIGVLPRHAVSERHVRWFDLPPFYAFHVANAWEEGSEVVLVASRYKEMHLEALGQEGELAPRGRPCLYEFRMCLRTGEARQRPLPGCERLPAEFPVVSPLHACRRARFAYAATAASASDGAASDAPGFLYDGLCKVALTDAAAAPDGSRHLASLRHGPGRYGGEAVFVPATSHLEGLPWDQRAAAREDDGHLVCFVHDENTGRSSLCVYSAATMSDTPVCEIDMPRRVPYGFHGLFVPERLLKGQA